MFTATDLDSTWIWTKEGITQKGGFNIYIYMCVCVGIPPINFWMPGPNFMKLGTYITAPEPVSTA
jgi:hypothetical protein